MRRRLVHGAVAGALLCVMGCSFSRGTLGDEFNAAQIATIKKGESSKAEVVTALGAPDRVLQMNGQELFQYYRYDAKAASLLLILVNIARLNIKSDDLFIWFNRDGVVHDVIFGKRTDTLTFKVWPGGD
jgi:outer membrane protein assembly factor BamE (lipoprotein component of BamABCDE complex)